MPGSLEKPWIYSARQACQACPLTIVGFQGCRPWTSGYVRMRPYAADDGDGYHDSLGSCAELQSGLAFEIHRSAG